MVFVSPGKLGDNLRVRKGQEYVGLQNRCAEGTEEERIHKHSDEKRENPLRVGNV